MIIQELASYYDSLVKAGEVGEEGWSKAKVSYALQLSDQGKLIAVVPLLKVPEGGKKEIPAEMVVPEQVKRSSGVNANFVCDNSTYMLGFDEKGKTDKERQKSRERAEKCFDAARDLHHKILDDVDDLGARALLAFFDTWSPQKSEDNDVLSNYKDVIFKGSNLVFVSANGEYLHENEHLRRAWSLYREKLDRTAVSGICLVSGERRAIARLHPSIKGIVGAQSSGASLVSYNTPSLESYGKEQGLNAPVSESIAFKYGSALNYLISNRDCHKRISDTTIIYWAETAETGYQDFWSDAFFEADDMTQERLNSIAEDICMGKAVPYKDTDLKSDTRFCVLGITPNAARLSVSFYSEGSFGAMLENIARFYHELSICKPKYAEDQKMNIWHLLDETANKKSRDKKSPTPVVSSVFRSILEGIPYPAGLFDNIMLRIRAEHDISWRKAAIIKAYLLRWNTFNNIESMKEVLTMELNESSENLPYVLGRIFAVLERIQQDANPGIKSTIKDKYFNSAAATPATVFPILFQLSHHHLRKLPDRGSENARSRNSYDRMIGELQNKIHVPYPARLSLQDQGVFYLGYYHQRQIFFKPKMNEEG